MGGFTAKKLKEIRALRDLSQSEVAKRLNISERKLRSIEANEHTLLQMIYLSLQNSIR